MKEAIRSSWELTGFVPMGDPRPLPSGHRTLRRQTVARKSILRPVTFRAAHGGNLKRPLRSRPDFHRLMMDLALRPTRSRTTDCQKVLSRRHGAGEQVRRALRLSSLSINVVITTAVATIHGLTAR